MNGGWMFDDMMMNMMMCFIYSNRIKHSGKGPIACKPPHVDQRKKKNKLRMPSLSACRLIDPHTGIYLHHQHSRAV